MSRIERTSVADALRAGAVLALACSWVADGVAQVQAPYTEDSYGRTICLSILSEPPTANHSTPVALPGVGTVLAQLDPTTPWPPASLGVDQDLEGLAREIVSIRDPVNPQRDRVYVAAGNGGVVSFQWFSGSLLKETTWLPDGTGAIGDNVFAVEAIDVGTSRYLFVGTNDFDDAGKLYVVRHDLFSGSFVGPVVKDLGAPVYALAASTVLGSSPGATVTLLAGTACGGTTSTGLVRFDLDASSFPLASIPNPMAQSDIVLFTRDIVVRSVGPAIGRTSRRRVRESSGSTSAASALSSGRRRAGRSWRRARGSHTPWRCRPIRSTWW